MTPQQAQIQDLLNTIDEVLNKTSPRLPWVMTGDADQQRRVLEQTRRYLVALQQQSEPPSSALASDVVPSPEGGPVPGGLQGYAQNYSPGYAQNYSQGYGASPVESAQQVLQAVLQEMSYLRTSVMQPMRSDLDMLYRQRESLVQEIKILEAQRQQYALSPESASQQQMMSDFLQSLMGRLQENLTGQVAQMLTNLEAQSSRDRALMGSADAAPSTLAPANSPYQPVLTPTERLEQLQRIQSQSDQLLLRLDSTLRVIFESLQANLQTYEDSLGLGLDKMHTLGQQGEAMFTALVNRLAQQLGREASNYLQSSIQDPSWPAPEPPVGEPAPAPTPSSSSPVDARATDRFDDEAELRTDIQTDDLSDELLEEQIDLLLSELRGDAPPDHLATDRHVAGPTAPPLELTDSEVGVSSGVKEPQGSNLSDLDRLNLEVDDLDLDASVAAVSSLTELDEELTLVQHPIAADDDDLTFFQVNEELTQFQLDDQDDDDFGSPTVPPLVDNLDSALDLLNQISTDRADLEADQAENPAFAASSPGAGGDRPSEQVVLSEGAEDTPSEELDEFYESLFGASAIAGEEEWVDVPVDQHVAAASDAVLEQEPGSLAPESTPLVNLDTQLFDGLADPALATAEDPTSLASELFGDFPTESLEPAMEKPEERSPQSVENLLFGEPVFSEASEVPAWEDEDETALLTSPSAATMGETALTSSASSEAIETIGSLTESIALLESSDPSTPASTETNSVYSEQQNADTRFEPTRTPSEDSYEAASADEDLLAVAESYDESRLDFQVDAETLQQLSADLFALEGSVGPSSTSLPAVEVSPPAAPQPPSDADLTIPLSEPDFVTQQGLGESLQEAMHQDLTLPIAPNQIVLGEADDDDEVDAVYRFLEESQSAAEPPVTPAAANLAEEDPTMPLLYPTPVYPLPLDDYAPTRSLAELIDEEAADAELTPLDLANPEPAELEPAIPEPPVSEILTSGLLSSLSDVPLPPGREDLSLSDYQTLMLMSTGDPDLSSLSVAAETVQHQELPPPSEPSPAPLPAASISTEDGEDSSEDTIDLDELFTDELFGDVATHPGEPSAPEPEAPFAFSTTPEPAISPDPDADSSVFLSDLFADIPTDPVATDAPLAGGMGANAEAFTLDGLGNLFEDLPPLEAATPILPPSTSASAGEAASPSSAASDLAVDTWTEAEPQESIPVTTDAEVALTAPDLDPEISADASLDTEDAKKKLLGLPLATPEDSAFTSSPASDLATEPVSTHALGNEHRDDELAGDEFSGGEFSGDEFDYEPDLDLDDVGLELELAIADLVNDLQTAPATARTDEPLPDDFGTLSAETNPTEADGTSLESAVAPEFDPALEAALSQEQTREQIIAQGVLRYLLTPDAGRTNLEDSSLGDPPLLPDFDPLDLDLPPHLPLSVAIVPSESASSEPASSDVLAADSPALAPISVAIASTTPSDSALVDPDLDADLSDADLLDADLDGIDLDGELLELDLQAGTRSPAGLTSQPDGEIKVPAGAAQAANSQSWYLGLDVGTTGISAVLLNHTTCELHPVYWLEIKFPAATADGSHRPIAAPEKTFRLPAAGYLPVPVEPSSVEPNSGTASTGDRLSAPSPRVLDGLTPIRIAPLAADAAFHLRQAAYPSRLLLRDFKPYLRTGVPYYSPQLAHWEPVVQWSERHAVPLSVFHQALRALLATLTCPLPTDPASQTSVLTCGAVGLDDSAFQLAMQQLAGIVVNYPANWSDTYSFNLREAILASRLVARPEQIFFVEETVATLLSGLRSTDGQPIVLPYSLSQQPDLHNNDWQGGTLVINAGATLTELALVNLPNQLQNLTHRDFTHRTVNYGGNALDQDIICQLIYPAWVRHLHQSAADAPDAESAYTFKSGVQAQAGTFSDGWNWQATDSAPDPWLSLGWDTLTLPTVGEPDLPSRYRLQQRLQSSPLGVSLIEAARQLKLSLQHQDHASMTLGAHTLVITRQDLGSRVLLLYIQRLNRELNALLNQTAIPVLAVNQVICSGGTASLAAIARWLRQKFPNATITQDTYSTAPQESALLACSRVAYGLATLPLHPQVLDRPRQQYSDYFLLMEILRVFPDQPVTINQLMQVLERRGIDTQSCQHHILALLEGRLPPGLLPHEKDRELLTPESIQNPDYQALQGTPLFFKQDAQTYVPNHQQWQQLRRYLDTLLATTHQKLAEPLVARLVTHET